MDLFRKNLAALEDREPELASYLRSLPDDPRIRFVDGGIEYRLHDGGSVRFERQVIPVNARKISDNRLFRFSEVIILVGIGLGEALTDTLKTADPTAFILVVESNPSFLKRLLQNFDLSKEISDPRVCVSSGENPVEAIMVRLESEFGVFTRPNFQVIKNGLSVSCDTEYYQQIDAVLSKQREMAESNLGSINMLSSLWQTNIMANLPYILGNPGISTLFGKMNGIPAIVVAAGPTLDKTCKWLKAAEDKMVIVCVDTALKTILKNGITPHFVFSLDALIENWTHLADVDTNAYTLVVNPVTYPEILAEHEGDMLLTSYSEPMVRWLEKFTGDLGLNVTGGSVATAAFDFAERIGCSPIILTGQDLAFTGGRTHSGGGSKEELLYNNVVSVDSRENAHKVAIDLEVMDVVEGNLGHRLATSHKMVTWKNWFEIQIEKRGIHCINATEGGAVIKGAEPATMQEVYNRYGSAKRDINGIIKKTKPLRMPFDIQEVYKSLGGIAASARSLKRTCTLGMKEASDMKKALERKEGGAPVDDRLDICKKYLHSIMMEGEFLDICHWRLEKALDVIQKMQSANKTSDKRKQSYIAAESYRIFFREMYGITSELEKKIAKYTSSKGAGSGTGKIAYAL